MRYALAWILATALGVGIGIGIGTVALAQSQSQPVIYSKRTEVVFTPTEVAGGRVGPNGVIIKVRPEVRHRNMIYVRTNFRRELLRSAHAL